MLDEIRQPLGRHFCLEHWIDRPQVIPIVFRLSEHDAQTLVSFAGPVASAFRSRLVVADFARLRKGGWCFIEAGPGSCAGSSHETVFKAVARRLRGEDAPLQSDTVGGPC